ncbi:MAG: hypothetical protein PVF73_01380 [Bacteroidales bacterium]|jgi:hypothetical protein
MSKKCIAVHLPVDLLDRINEQKAKTGQSQSGLITGLIEKGLGSSSHENAFGKLFFFVKVRIDTAKMTEFGQKLQNGEIDTSHTIMTYCIKDDPAVGLSFWHADSQKSFEDVFAQHRVYYKEVTEVIPVITPMDSMKLIMENLQKL